MRKLLLIALVFLLSLVLSGGLYRRVLLAQTSKNFISPTPTPFSTPIPMPEARDDLTEETEPVIDRLEKLLDEQELGAVWPANPVKYAIRGSVASGVPTNTITLLLLLPLVASIIAAARHIIGIRGFCIFLPAALSVVFVAIGPIVGIGLFLLIITISTFRKSSGNQWQFIPISNLIFCLIKESACLSALALVRQSSQKSIMLKLILIISFLMGLR